MLRWLLTIVLSIVLVMAVVSQASDLDTEAQGPSSFEVRPNIFVPAAVPPPSEIDDTAVEVVGDPSTDETAGGDEDPLEAPEEESDQEPSTPSEGPDSPSGDDEAFDNESEDGSSTVRDETQDANSEAEKVDDSPENVTDDGEGGTQGDPGDGDAGGDTDGAETGDDGASG